MRTAEPPSLLRYPGTQVIRGAALSMRAGREQFVQDDPRRILDRAAQARARCHMLPRGSSVVSGSVVRVERGGVLVSAPARQLNSGTDVKVWVQLDPHTWVFHATVLRTRLPVPGQGEEGLLLGYIDRFERESVAESAGGGRRLDLIPTSGRGISLLRHPARLVHLGLDGLTFTLPSASKLVFVENAALQVVLSDAAAGSCAGTVRVSSLQQVDGALLYDLEWVDVDAPDRLRVLVQVLRGG